MMLRDANDAGNDGLLLEYYTMDDIDIPTLERYRRMFQTLHPEHQWNSSDHKTFMMNFGGYTKDRRTGIEGLTMAGLLMFGKGLPVRERFDNLRMDYIDKSNLIGDQRYSDRLTYDGTWENNLFNFTRIVIPKLTKDLPRPFHMDGVIRTDDTLQAKAIREAVTNMIIHSDFMLNGVLKVEKYDDRLVLTNPGLLKLPLEQIYKGGESKARNQRMQNMFRMIGYGENLGSGFPLILNAWNEKHWLKPELLEQPELMQVKLTLHIQNNTINDPINDMANIAKLTDRQRKIYDVIKSGTINDQVNVPINVPINVPYLATLFAVSEKTIKRDLYVLRDMHFIKYVGSNKTGHWEVIG